MRNTISKEHACRIFPRAARVAALITGLSIMHGASADDFLAGERNRTPVSGLFLLNAVDVDTSDSSRVDWTTVSHSASDEDAGGAILFDGETSVLALTFNKQWSSRWSTSATLPYLWHSGGALDRFIDNWHAAFGLPDGIRNDRPRNTLQFEFVTPGNVAIARNRNTHGPGDILLGARRRLGPTDSPWSLLLGAKLPTGDAERLTGSGAADGSVAIGWRSGTTDKRWQFDANAGVALLGDADVRFDEQRRQVVFGQLSVVRQVHDRLQLGARLQLHSAALDAGPDAVTATAIGLVIGGQWALHDQLALNITVGEDLSVDVLPDVSFRIGLSLQR